MTTADTNEELELLRRDGEAALAQLFAACQPRLERILRFRIDPRIRGRVESADVLQETWLTAARRLSEYCSSLRFHHLSGCDNWYCRRWWTSIGMNFGSDETPAAKCRQHTPARWPTQACQWPISCWPS